MKTVENNIIVEQTQKDYSSFDNYSKKKVSLIGYLIGVKDSFLSKDPFDQEYLKNIDSEEELKIIRALSTIRLNFLFSYDKIFQEKKSLGAFAQFDKMDKYIDVNSLKYLHDNNIIALQVGIDASNLTLHIAHINQLIEDRIDNLHEYIPEWIKWEYIKELFIMPGCSSGNNDCHYKTKAKAEKINNKIHEIRKVFYDNMIVYPYRTYLNWNPRYLDESCGNILFNDRKFLDLLYTSHKDVFKGDKYVIDAKSSVKDSIYDFIEQANNVAIFVDCENVDPYGFAATLKNLDETKISKIKKVVLLDDENTTNAWEVLQNVLKLPVEHEIVKRIKEDKSLVDHALSIFVAKAFYKENNDSVIIASSDSDFWSLIYYLPDTKFLVLNESDKTSQAIINKLDENLVSHCFMDDFAKDKIQIFKNITLKKNLQIYLDEFNESGILQPLCIDEMIDFIFFKAGINDAYKQIEQEKKDFFNKYIKNIKLTIVTDKNGNRLFKLVTLDY